MTSPGTPRDHLLINGSTDALKRMVMQGLDRVASRIGQVDKPFTGIAPEALALEVQGVDLDEPLGTAGAVLDELEKVYLRDAVYFHHPRCLAHLNCPVVIPALLGEAVLSAVNS
ncbi:pyridoxal-dependent decarboxylase, partial [Actinoplanes sp. NPDC051633]